MLPTYEPALPDRNPMFLEKRVYQGSSGRVYPLPFIDRIAESPVDRPWDAIYLDNGLIEVMLLPEVGGRIHAGRDLTNGYDFFYRQDVIKPALVGLAGPWISGGVEFNWPQHHRPSTYMPTQVAVEHGEDGSITVWMGEHDPMDRTKGMHGVCLHPGRSVIELKVRLYNRTPYVQSFLWWANFATHVHEGYKSFFPPDANMVADHAKRALSRYPQCEGHYYGVDYGTRGQEGIPENELPAQFLPKHAGGNGPEYAPNDLSWYANIPVPTSYMCLGSKHDFVGGYDHFAHAGLIHVADRHIAPGKKQWTWGNHEFGYAWDRNLTDADGPYIEIMAGVYTDNQPDFSWIGPGETKTFSQFWYPYQAIGPVQFANIDAAIRVSGGKLGVAVTRPMEVTIEAIGAQTATWQTALNPGQPFLIDFADAREVTVRERETVVARYVHEETPPTEFEMATEPPMPEDVASADELYLTGLHLWQYRHATRSPLAYWKEAIRRDPGDARCNNAIGLWHFRRGEFAEAEPFFRAAIERLTRRNPNPFDGEPYYNLGVTLWFLGRDNEAVDAFGKAVWNAAWQAPGYHALGELACRRGDWTRALDYLDRALRKDADNFRAANLRVMVHRQLGKAASASEVLVQDPLDIWAQYLEGRPVMADNQMRIDLAIDLSRAGFSAEAREILAGANLDARDGSVPLVHYYTAQTLPSGLERDAALQFAKTAPLDYCFPSRLEDYLVLAAAPAGDARAHFYRGNYLYDRRRYEEAISAWEVAAEWEPGNSIAWRNLGIAYFNVRHDAAAARVAYDRAIDANPTDARLWYERDQLWKRVGESPEARFRQLAPNAELVRRRDDLTIEYCALLNALGRWDEAADILRDRQFQPWEGGEGMALGIWSRTQRARARRAITEGRWGDALTLLESVANPPQNLCEARHLLANDSETWLAMGDVLCGLGRHDAAQTWWGRAANFKGDFQEMSLRRFSEMTLFQADALRRLGRDDEADRRLEELESYAHELAATPAKIDYFATSLPTMLLFDDDLDARQVTTARFLQAQSLAGRGEKEAATNLLRDVLSRDPNHAMAQDLREWLDPSAC